MSEAGPSALGPLIVDVEGIALTDDDRALLAHPAVGGVILFTKNYRDREQLAALIRAMRAARRDLLIVADTEGGRVQRFRDGFTTIPAMRSLGDWFVNAPDAALAGAREIAWLLADELRAVGVDLPLAPVVDIDPDCASVIGDRALAADADAVSRLAKAWAGGLAEAGSAATAKHFPGHGAVVADSHTDLPVDDRAWPALAADMQPYRALIDAGLASVMTAHVRYASVDLAPASFSRRWVSGILRGQLAFAGCVFCDDLSMAGAATIGDCPARVQAALEAGCDLLPVCHDRAAVAAALEPALAADSVQSRGRRATLGRVLAANARAAGAPAAQSARRASARALCQRLNTRAGPIGSWQP